MVLVVASVLIRGVGDIGSAIGHRLFVAGRAVVLHDGPNPTTTRRGMAFADAIFDGRAVLNGVEAIRVDDVTRLLPIVIARNGIPAITTDFDDVLIERETCSNHSDDLAGARG